jgi:hypothetical protein
MCLVLFTDHKGVTMSGSEQQMEVSEWVTQEIAAYEKNNPGKKAFVSKDGKEEKIINIHSDRDVTLVDKYGSIEVKEGWPVSIYRHYTWRTRGLAIATIFGPDVHVTIQSLMEPKRFRVTSRR